MHLSEIARSLNETITFKKTIDRLSRNPFAFDQKERIMENYISEVKKIIDEDHAVIVIDNSDITKPCSPKMEAISDIHDGSTGEIRKEYMTAEAAVLSKEKKLPVSVYEKGSSSAEKGFISVTHENFCYLKSLSAQLSCSVWIRGTAYVVADKYRYVEERKTLHDCGIGIINPEESDGVYSDNLLQSLDPSLEHKTSGYAPGIHYKSHPNQTTLRIPILPPEP